MTLNILAAPTERDAGDRDQATQAQECIPPLPVGQAGDAKGSCRGSAWDAEGEEPVSGHWYVSAAAASTCCSITQLGSLHALVPQFPSCSWGGCSSSSPASGPPRPRAGEQHAVPAPLLGSVPGRTQAVLVCSLASIPALPSPPSGLGRQVLPPRPTNRLEQLPAPRGGETALPGARGGGRPQNPPHLMLHR